MRVEDRLVEGQSRPEVVPDGGVKQTPPINVILIMNVRLI